MINYDRDVNACNIPKQAMITCVLLTSGDNYKAVYDAVVEAESWCHSILYNNHDKEIAKEIKSNWKKDISQYITDGYCIDRIADPRMALILAADIPLREKLNVAMSVARWPEFYMYSDEELRDIGSNIKDHVSEINAINFYKDNGDRVCPYDPTIYHNDMDWKGTLRAQDPAVRQFMIANNISVKFTVEELILCIDQIKSDIASNKPLSSFDYLEQGFIESCRHIRSYAKTVCAEMKQYADGQGAAEQFGLSESASPLSKDERVMQTLHSLGYTKNSCPMVLANIFYPDLGQIPIRVQKGQIPVKHFRGDCFETAPGLGPAFKIRFVFNTDENIQNYLSPYASTIQYFDKQYDPMEAYNAQMDRLLEDLPYISDAFCTDSTGFSDYMTRCIYKIMMEIHGIDTATQNVVMQIFRMPIKVGDEYHNVKFGAMQGCKLLVFIMNHANRLMGILAHRLNKMVVDCRCNAGDDVEAHRFNGKYTKAEIDTELGVFSYFNCPTNDTKTAWLNRDGYFDFCSKYYAKIPGSEIGVFSITGLPPKSAGKEIISITGFAELFKVLDIAQTEHRSCIESWNILYPLLEPTLLEGMTLPSADKSRTTLDDKIRRAMQYSYDVGGLQDNTSISCESRFRLLKHKMNIIMTDYIFEADGIFLLINKMDEDFKSTELFKALGTVARQSMKDIIHIINIINANEDDIDADEVDWALSRISRFERNIIRGLSVSRSNSTYHRKNALRDIDMYTPVDIIDNATESCIPAAESVLEASMLIDSLSNSSFIDIDNIRKYVRMFTIYRSCKGRIKKYGDAYDRQYWAYEDTDGLLVRLTSEDSYYRHGDMFKNLDDIIDPAVRELCIYLRESDTITLCNQLTDSLDRNISSITMSMLRSTFKRISVTTARTALNQMKIAAIRSL